MAESPRVTVKRFSEVLASAHRRPVPGPEVLDRWRLELVMALYLGEFDRARRIVLGAVRELPPATVLDDVLAEAMHDIGVLWEGAAINVADEHLATGLVQRLLTQVSALMEAAAPATRETVLLATPPRESHATGLLMAASVLEGAGYVTVQLGAGIPSADLVAALERHRPALVGLSATMPWQGDLARTLDAVLEVLPDASVLTGGAAAATAPPRERVHLVQRMSELVGTTEKVLAGAAS